MRRQALVATVLVMMAAGVVALILRSALDTTPSIWGVEKAYFFANIVGLVMGGVLTIVSVTRRDLRRYVPGFTLIALVMAARLATQVFPLSLRADILMVSASLPLGLVGGAMVIWEWQRMRTVGTRAVGTKTR